MNKRSRYPMDKWRAHYWQMVWFFSMEAQAQAPLIGPTEEEWFIEEDETNRGANYLCGLLIAFIEYRNSAPESPLAEALLHKIMEIGNHHDPQYWRFAALIETPEWHQAKRLAKELLDLEKPLVTPPRKPFVVEDLIWVEEFAHASVIRQQERLLKKR